MSDTPAILSFKPSAVESAASGRHGSREEPRRADIIRLPADLRDIKTPRSVKGEVIRAERDGRIALRTESGTVEVRTDKPETFKQGQTLDIRLPAGNPPDQALIRPAAGPKEPIQPQNTGPDVQNQVNAPPVKISLQPGASIPLKPLGAQDIDRLTRPFIAALPAQALSQAFDIKAKIIKTEITGAQLSLITASLRTLPAPTQPLTPSSLLQPPESPLTAYGAPESTILPGGLDKPSLQRFLPLIGENFIQTGKTEGLRPEEFPVLSARAGKALIAQILPPEIRLAAPGEDAELPPPAQETPKTVFLPEGRPETLKGIVVGFTPEQNFPALQLTAPPGRAGQVFAVPLPTGDIPLGSGLELAPQQPLAPGQAQPVVATPPPVMPALYFTTPESWPLLQEVQQAVAQISAQTAQLMSNVTPTPASPANFGPAALFFLAAVRAGDINGWLGERAAEILKSKGGNLLARLTQELSSLNRFMAEQPAQDWRSAALPLGWNNEIHKIVIHTRREDRQNHDDENQKGGNTRFVINLSLSQMGPVQLDALYQAPGKRLDLILRTENDFSAAMKAEMRRAYKAALDETAITGELSFHGKGEGWVTIQTAYENYGTSV